MYSFHRLNAPFQFPPLYGVEKVPIFNPLNALKFCVDQKGCRLKLVCTLLIYWRNNSYRRQPSEFALTLYGDIYRDIICAQLNCVSIYVAIYIATWQRKWQCHDKKIIFEIFWHTSGWAMGKIRCIPHTLQL